MSGRCLPAQIEAPVALTHPTVRVQIYLKPWRALATAGMRGVMVAHSTTLHIPNHANVWLIDHVLREALGFGDGVVLTDDNNIINLVSAVLGSSLNWPASSAQSLVVDVRFCRGPTSCCGWIVPFSVVESGTFLEYNCWTHPLIC